MAPTPVIIVPGVMGTRLVDAQGNRVWDPDTSGGLTGAWRTWRNSSLRQLNDMSRSLSPNPRTDNLPAGTPTHVMAVPGVGNLVWGAYHRLVTALSDPALSRRSPAGIRVYVCGYDWRRSNAVSATRLGAVVGRAVRETGAPRAIVVAHSMGGLVSRWFCRFRRVSGRRGEDLMAGLILLGSPTHGASKAYRALRQGFATPDDISDIELDLGPDTTEGALIGGFLAAAVRDMPSLYELLPTQAFCSAHPDWVLFDTRRAGFPDASNATRLYASDHTGIGGAAAARAAHLAHRSRFDHGIGTYLPPRTMILYSSALPTETRYRITWSGLRREGGAAANRGDGTVPTVSARAGLIRTPSAWRRDLGRIDHGGLANHPTAVAEVVRLALRICASAASSSAPRRERAAV